jgi:hypothetical protein
MRWIDFEGKLPTDADIPDWEAWPQQKWDAWLAKTEQLDAEVKRLHDSGNIEARNAYIDKHSSHWGKLKPWLLALSRGKCWFTEAREIASHMDVEHFRPKKGFFRI